MEQTSFDRGAFRKALGTFLTGITVVATLQEDGEPRGFTANSFTSVSLDPPLVLICIAKTASSYPVFTAASHFSVNVLAETQAEIAEADSRYQYLSRLAALQYAVGGSPNTQQ